MLPTISNLVFLVRSEIQCKTIFAVYPMVGISRQKRSWIVSRAGRRPSSRSDFGRWADEGTRGRSTPGHSRFAARSTHSVLEGIFSAVMAQSNAVMHVMPLADPVFFRRWNKYIPNEIDRVSIPFFPWKVLSDKCWNNIPSISFPREPCSDKQRWGPEGTVVFIVNSTSISISILICPETEVMILYHII